MARVVKSRLKQLRLNKAAQLGRDVPLKEVYDVTGIAISTLSRIETNQAKGVEFATLVKLADFYGVSNIGDLLSLEEIRHALRLATARHATSRRAEVEAVGLVDTIPALHP